MAPGRQQPSESWEPYAISQVPAHRLAELTRPNSTIRHQRECLACSLRLAAAYVLQPIQRNSRHRRSSTYVDFSHGSRSHPLYVFPIMELGRRQILHYSVTAHPSAEWTLQ